MVNMSIFHSIHTDELESNTDKIWTTEEDKEQIGNVFNSNIFHVNWIHFTQSGVECGQAVCFLPKIGG